MVVICDTSHFEMSSCTWPAIGGTEEQHSVGTACHLAGDDEGMEGLERRWGGARGRRAGSRPRFGGPSWYVADGTFRCRKRVIGFPAVNIRCKPGMSSSKHVDRGRDLGGVPLLMALSKA